MYLSLSLDGLRQRSPTARGYSPERLASPLSYLILSYLISSHLSLALNPNGTLNLKPQRIGGARQRQRFAESEK